MPLLGQLDDAASIGDCYPSLAMCPIPRTQLKLGKERRLHKLSSDLMPMCTLSNRRLFIIWNLNMVLPIRPSCLCSSNVATEFGSLIQLFGYNSHLYLVYVLHDFLFSLVCVCFETRSWSELALNPRSSLLYIPNAGMTDSHVTECCQNDLYVLRFVFCFLFHCFNFFDKRFHVGRLVSNLKCSRPGFVHLLSLTHPLWPPWYGHAPAGLAWWWRYFLSIFFS